MSCQTHLTGQMEKRDVLLDLAVGMYAARHLALGRAAELAGVSQGDFQRELGRHEKELNRKARSPVWWNLCFSPIHAVFAWFPYFAVPTAFSRFIDVPGVTLRTSARPTCP